MMGLREDRGKRDVISGGAPAEPRDALPRFLPPQLATIADEAPAGDDWLHELKHDGYRIVARLDQGRARLLSRNGRDWTDRFTPVASGVERLPAGQAMLDGEVAVLLPDGITSFQALQNRLSGAKEGQLVYMVFDLLHLDGRDLTRVGVEDRKAVLRALLDAAGPGAAPLRYSDHVIGSGPEFFARACRLGLEGAISKRRDAPYRGTRNSDWVKVKCVKRQEVVIAGYTDPEGSRVGLGALLAGVHDRGRLVYAGKVGTGFTGDSLRDLKERLGQLDQAECPFETRPAGVPRAHWVKPELVAEVEFGQWTDDGKMRHPSFLGLREDKPAAEVVRERPAGVHGAKREQPMRTSRKGETIDVAGVRLTHADRVLYPPQGITKLDLARFYESIAGWILPHLRDRPTALVRCPEGVDRECFYQKHTASWAPEALRRVTIKEKTKVGEYLVVDDLPGLIGLVQMGILEIHTWNSVATALERPNRLVFDLDPAPGVPWPRVIEGARLIRARLEALALESFVKTTGGKGLHVVVPLAPGPTWDEGWEFARALAEAITREDPSRYTAQMAKSARGGKIFIDYLRNVRGATSVAAYSTRARAGAPVSVPLEWDELSDGVTSDHFTVANLPDRLAALRRDPWSRYGSARQTLPSRSARASRSGPAAPRSRRAARRR